MEVTKRLGNLPPNICTPTYLGEQARKIARQWKLGVEVLETKQLEALKMGSFLAVAKGSAQPPRLIVMKYNGAGTKAAPVVLVGKGITFDSGGISLKPGAAMDEMKYDMCGAASVLGTMRALAELKLQLNVVGIVAACENMPAGNADQAGRHRDVDVRPDDRDPEHRRRGPADPVRRPHLRRALQAGRGDRHGHADRRLRGRARQRRTRACSRNNEDLAGELLAASKAAGDAAWRMPLDEDYQEQLEVELRRHGEHRHAGQRRRR